MEANSAPKSLFFGDYKVFVNDSLCKGHGWKQYRFPKSKKRRIRKKWAKQNKNFKSQEFHRAYKIGNALYVSSEVYEKLKKLDLKI